MALFLKLTVLYVAGLPTGFKTSNFFTSIQGDSYTSFESIIVQGFSSVFIGIKKTEALKIKASV